MRFLTAVLIGLGVGLAVVIFVNYGIYVLDVTWPPHLTGFWGLFYGAFAAPAAFGLSLMWMNRGGRASHPEEQASSSRRWAATGRWIAAIVLIAFSALVIWFIWAWGLSLATLEGAWIYPLGFVPLIAAGMLLASGGGKTSHIGRALGAGALLLFSFTATSLTLAEGAFGMWVGAIVTLSLVLAVIWLFSSLRPRRDAGLRRRGAA